MQQQKGRTEQLLDSLAMMIENASNALSPGKVTVSKDEMLSVIKEISDNMQSELRQYRDVTDKRAKVLNEAKKEAEDIIYEAEKSASRIRVSGRKNGVSPVRLNELSEEEQLSLSSANEIYAASLIYTDEMLTEMEEVIVDAYYGINECYNRALLDLRKKSELIATNRKELMEDLKSIEVEERYQQILDIGKLLSNELYHARKKELSDKSMDKNQLQLDLGDKKPVVFETEDKEQKKEAIASEIITQSMTWENRVTDNSEIDPVVAAALKEKSEIESLKKKTRKAEASGDTVVMDDVKRAATRSPFEMVDSPTQKFEKLRKIPGGVTSEVNSVLVEAEAALNDTEQKDPTQIIEDLAENHVTSVKPEPLPIRGKIERESVEVTDVTEQLEREVKKNSEPSLSSSVIEAMKRAAKKAVGGLMEGEDMLYGVEEEEYEEYDPEYDEEPGELETPKPSTNRTSGNEASPVPGFVPTPEMVEDADMKIAPPVRERKVPVHEELFIEPTMPFDPIQIRSAQGIDPVVAAALKERQEQRRALEGVDEDVIRAAIKYSPTTEVPVKDIIDKA